jgi:hypothetical protein
LQWPSSLSRQPRHLSRIKTWIPSISCLRRGLNHWAVVSAVLATLLDIPGSARSYLLISCIQRCMVGHSRLQASSAFVPSWANRSTRS